MKSDTLDFLIVGAALAVAWWIKKPTATSTTNTTVDDNWLSVWGLKK